MYIMDKEMNMDSQTWYIVRTTHESGQRVESRRFGIDAVERYIDQCIDEHGPLQWPASVEFSISRDHWYGISF